MRIPSDDRVIWLEKTDSTSAWLRREQERLPSPVIVAVLEQTDGRGQGDHLWHSAPGQNLTFSILLRYDDNHPFAAREQQLLTMSSSLAVCDFLEGEGIDGRIKRPNDIYAGGGKICGMLIENSLHGPLMKSSIVGMGINVNETFFPADLPCPVSMAGLSGRPYDIKKCLWDFLKHFFERLNQIWDSPRTLRREYDEKLLFQSAYCLCGVGGLEHGSAGNKDVGSTSGQQ